jgi:hypothetical protein
MAKNFRFATYLLFFVSFLIITSGCNQTPTEPDNVMVLQNNVVVLDNLSSLSDPEINGDEYVYTYTGSPPNINVGDVLVGQTGYGYIRKVRGVTVQQDQIICQTDFAGVTDVIEEGYFQDSVQLVLGDKEGDGVSMQPLFLDEGVSFTKEKGINISSKILIASSQCSLRLKNSYISFDPEVSLEHNIISSNPYIDFSVTGNVTHDITAEASWNTGVEIDETIAPVPIASFISPVPVFWIGPIPVYAGVEMSAVYSMHVGAYQTTHDLNVTGDHSVTCGITYENGNTTPYTDLSVSGAFSDTEHSGGSVPVNHVQVGIACRALLMVAGTVGPKAGPHVYLKYTNTTQNDQYVDQLYLGTSFKLSLALNVWYIQLAEVGFDIFANEIPLKVATPIFSPPGGNYSSAQNVTITSSTSGAQIKYTLDGSPPTQTSNTYTSPISVTGNTTIMAKAFKSGMLASSTSSAVYDLSLPSQVATPTFSPPGGTYSSPQSVSISCATAGATIRYTTNGSEPTVSSPQYTGPINVSTTTTLKAKAYKSGWTPSSTSNATYTISITQTVATPTFNPPGGNYTSAQIVSISCTTSGATIRYTTNGSEPTESSAQYTGPVNVSATTTLKAKGYKSGWTPSATASATYTISPTQTVATPTFSPPGGTYDTAQSVSISCATAGAMIRYTTNGNEPTESSAQYTGPINVSSTTTLKAKAYKSGWTPSATASAVFIIETGGGEWIGWCYNILGNSVGTGGDDVYNVAHRFDQTDLAPHQGNLISQVKFVPAYADCVYTVKVWTGGSASDAGTLVSSQVVSNITLDQWNLCVLNTPVAVPSTGDLYIGYECNAQGGQPLGCDLGPQFEGYGNMMYWQGSWTTLSQVSPSLTYNWLILGYVEYANPKHAPIIHPCNTQKLQRGHLKNNSHSLESYNQD